MRSAGLVLVLLLMALPVPPIDAQGAIAPERDGLSGYLASVDPGHCGNSTTWGLVNGTRVAVSADVMASRPHAAVPARALPPLRPHAVALDAGPEWALVFSGSDPSVRPLVASPGNFRPSPGIETDAIAARYPLGPLENDVLPAWARPLPGDHALVVASLAADCGASARTSTDLIAPLGSRTLLAAPIITVAYRGEANRDPGQVAAYGSVRAFDEDHGEPTRATRVDVHATNVAGAIAHELGLPASDGILDVRNTTLRVPIAAPRLTASGDRKLVWDLDGHLDGGIAQDGVLGDIQPWANGTGLDLVLTFTDGPGKERFDGTLWVGWQADSNVAPRLSRLDLIRYSLEFRELQVRKPVCAIEATCIWRVDASVAGHVVPLLSNDARAQGRAVAAPGTIPLDSTIEFVAQRNEPFRIDITGWTSDGTFLGAATDLWTRADREARLGSLTGGGNATMVVPARDEPSAGDLPPACATTPSGACFDAIYVVRREPAPATLLNVLGGVNASADPPTTTGKAFQVEVVVQDDAAGLARVTEGPLAPGEPTQQSLRYGERTVFHFLPKFQDVSIRMEIATSDGKQTLMPVNYDGRPAPLLLHLDYKLYPPSSAIQVRAYDGLKFDAMYEGTTRVDRIAWTATWPGGRVDRTLAPTATFNVDPDQTGDISIAALGYRDVIASNGSTVQEQEIGATAIVHNTGEDTIRVSPTDPLRVGIVGFEAWGFAHWPRDVTWELLDQIGGTLSRGTAIPAGASEGAFFVDIPRPGSFTLRLTAHQPIEGPASPAPTKSIRIFVADTSGLALRHVWYPYRWGSGLPTRQLLRLVDVPAQGSTSPPARVECEPESLAPAAGTTFGHCSATRDDGSRADLDVWLPGAGDCQEPCAGFAPARVSRSAVGGPLSVLSADGAAARVGGLLGGANGASLAVPAPAGTTDVRPLRDGAVFIRPGVVEVHKNDSKNGSTRSSPVSAAPALDADDARGRIAVADPGRVTLFDEDLDVVATARGPSEPIAVALDAAHDAAAVADGAAGVALVSFIEGGPSWEADLGAVTDVAIDRASGAVFALDAGTRDVVKLDRASGAVLARAPAGALPVALALTDAGDLVVVADRASDALLAFSSTDLSSKGRAATPHAPTDVVDAGDGRLAVTALGDLATQIMKEFPRGQPLAFVERSEFGASASASVATTPVAGGKAPADASKNPTPQPPLAWVLGGCALAAILRRASRA